MKPFLLLFLFHFLVKYFFHYFFTIFVIYRKASPSIRILYVFLISWIFRGAANHIKTQDRINTIIARKKDN